MKPFRDELETLLNCYSKENESNTPDFVLTRYVERCLDAFDEAVRQRDRWYGVHLTPGESYFERDRQADERVKAERVGKWLNLFGG